MMLLLVLACAHRGAAKATDTGETGAVGDSGDPADPHEPCGAWAGLDRGARWTYEPTDAYVEAYGFDGSFTVEVTSLVGDSVTVAQVGAYAGDAGDFSWEREDTWRCDDAGAWLVLTESSSVGTSGGQGFGSTGWRAYAPGWLQRPARAGGWQDSFTLTSEVNDVEIPPVEVTCDSEATPDAEWTGPGGPADTLAVETICSQSVPDPFVLAAGVGLVRSADEELVAFTP